MSKPRPNPDDTPASEYLVAVLQWDDRAVFGEALRTPDGQAAVADVATFATGGAEMLTGEVTSYV